jgi:hypothetical protein
MKQINDKLDGLSELVTRIDAKILDINTKLDELIKALHEYDDENNLHCEYSGLPSVKAYDNEKDILSWDVDGAERRTHHVTNEEADDDARSNNTQTKHTGEPKKRNKRYYKPKAK